MSDFNLEKALLENDKADEKKRYYHCLKKVDQSLFSLRPLRKFDILTKKEYKEYCKLQKKVRHGLFMCNYKINGAFADNMEDTRGMAHMFSSTGTHIGAGAGAGFAVAGPPGAVAGIILGAATGFYNRPTSSLYINTVARKKYHGSYEKLDTHFKELADLTNTYHDRIKSYSLSTADLKKLSKRKQKKLKKVLITAKSIFDAIDVAYSDYQDAKKLD